ncbi:MAG: prepilin-type N-terminal cleavage/methylation domain-containing protein [Elusimicrobia bacterium]|nr:prepilin-type N-terminal cleavage/methylation domain-containing protein [Elusimicrobiota bacterium]
MNRIRRGFTLIELLVVVLIIGILASIAIPQYFKVVEKSRISEAMSLVAAIKSAEERYLARGGTYSTDFKKLDITYPNMTSTAITTKFFSAAIADASDANGPGYTLTITRHTTNSSVAARYGTYALTCSVPTAPAVTSAKQEVKDELLD